MTREEEIKEMAKSYAREVCGANLLDIVATIEDFQAGAKWADEHPRVQ